MKLLLFFSHFISTSHLICCMALHYWLTLCLLSTRWLRITRDVRKSIITVHLVGLVEFFFSKNNHLITECNNGCVWVLLRTFPTWFIVKMMMRWWWDIYSWHHFCLVYQTVNEAFNLTDVMWRVLETDTVWLTLFTHKKHLPKSTRLLLLGW
jgi:hypothetical protein